MDDGEIEPEPDQLRPLGTLVSGCLRIPSGPAFDPVREAASAVDQVHGDGTLPGLPVGIGASRIEAASYRWDERSGRPRALDLSRFAPRPQLAVVHEIGHLLDQRALGTGRELASESGRVPEIMRCIAQTQAVRRLTELQRRRQLLIQVRPRLRERFTLDQGLIEYLLEPRELFARAYAQDVTNRSGDERLVAQLQSVQGDVFLSMVYHQQWDDDDFSPVVAAFDQMMRQRRWIK